MADTQYHLSYKTRGDSSPQGKPKVYFCCHPDDFGYLFEEISNEILAEQNCSVWYADPVDAVRDEEFLNDLSRMQLFVMPVTAKLLYLKNHAIDVEFPFAVEHHIPILPLMQDSDLEGIFNQKCADLQFLDKTLVMPQRSPTRKNSEPIFPRSSSETSLHKRFVTLLTHTSF